MKQSYVNFIVTRWGHPKGVQSNQEGVSLSEIQWPSPSTRWCVKMWSVHTCQF